MVVDLPKDVRPLTVRETKYLKGRHLRGLDGYDGIARFMTFFSEASARVVGVSAAPCLEVCAVHAGGLDESSG